MTILEDIYFIEISNLIFCQWENGQVIRQVSGNSSERGYVVPMEQESLEKKKHFHYILSKRIFGGKSETTRLTFSATSLFISPRAEMLLSDRSRCLRETQLLSCSMTCVIGVKGIKQ